MNLTSPPVHSLKSLIVASTAALLLAGLVLVFFVLPAEYGVDPTGFGKKFGLTALSPRTGSRNQPESEAYATTAEKSTDVICPGEENNANQKPDKPLPWKDTVKIIIPPKDGLEYKFQLAKGASLEYSWTTDGTQLYFDFHGEPKGDKSGYFKSFKESTDSQSSGSLTAPFEGSHGWYWENKTRVPVTVILNTSGAYEILGIM